MESVLSPHHDKGQALLYLTDEQLRQGIEAMFFAYRGFSGNDGKPHEEGLYKDAKAAKLWLNQKNISDEQIILYGESLGTAIAIDLAAENLNFNPNFTLEDGIKSYLPEISRLHGEDIL